jgi:serine/threonine protein phosphatase PrpC
MGPWDLRAGDRYLLCSDGLSPVVDDRTLRNVLTLRAASAVASATWPP